MSAGGDDDARPGRMQHAMRSFRIDPQIKFAARRLGEFGIVGDRIQARTHHDQLFRERSEFRIDRLRERKIRQRAAFVDCDLVRILAHHAHEKVRGVFVGGLRGGHAFGHRGNVIRPMHGMAARVIPRALIDDLAVERFPSRDEFFRVYERERRAGDDWNVRRPMISIRRSAWSVSSGCHSSPVTVVMPSTSVVGDWISARIASVSVPPGPAQS